MPFDTQPRERNIGTGRACRAVVAARLLDPPRDLEVFRALQLARFTTTTLFDTDDGLRAALARVDGLDAAALVAALDDPEVEAAYQADRAEVRTAAGSPTALQGKSANTDGLERYTAPSLVFRHASGRVLEAGGYQPSRPTTCAWPTSTPGWSGARRPRTPSRCCGPSPMRSRRARSRR